MGNLYPTHFCKCCNSSSVISEMIWMWFRNLSAYAAMAVDLNLRWTSSSCVRWATFAASRDGAELKPLHCDIVEWAVDPVTQHEKLVREHMKVHYKKSHYITRHQEEGEIHTYLIMNNNIFNCTTDNTEVPGHHCSFDALEPRSVTMMFVVSLVVLWNKKCFFFNCFPPPQLLICETVAFMTI